MKKDKIEEMRKSMIDAGFYKLEDVEEICRIESEFIDECNEISEQCIAEGYPSRGSNYDIRCSEARRFYDERIAIIDSKYDE